MLKRSVALGGVFTFGILMGIWMSPPLRAQVRSGQTRTLLQTDLTGFCDGKEALVEVVDAGPGTSQPWQQRG